MSSLCFSYEWWRHGIWSIYIPSLAQLTSDSSVVYNQEMYMSPLSPLFDGNKRKRRAKELYTILVLSLHNYLRACLPSGISWVEISHWSETTALDAFCSLREIRRSLKEKPYAEYASAPVHGLWPKDVVVTNFLIGKWRVNFYWVEGAQTITWLDSPLRPSRGRYCKCSEAF